MNKNGAKNQTTINPTILEQMRPSLVIARKYNNKKAISRDFINGNPLVKDPDKVFDAWCKTIGDLYRTIQPWAENFNNKDAKDADLQAIYTATVAQWVKLTSEVDPKMFARSNDVHRIMGFALKYGPTTKGSVDVLTSMTSFRQAVETMLGIRIAQGQVLTEEESDLIKKYDKTTKNIDKLQDRLDGTTNAKGEHKEGLTEQLETAKNKLAEVIELVKGYAGKDVDVDDNPIIAGYAQAVEDIEDRITKTKKAITDAKEYLKNNKKAYEKAMKKVNDITE